MNARYAMSLQKKLYTIDEFERFVALPRNADRRFELIDGEIVEKMPTEEHGIIALNVGSELRAFVKKHRLGRVAVEARHALPDDAHNDRLPDVSFVSAEHNLPVVEKGPVPRMPDLAVEVKSPDDSDDDLRAKAMYYLRNGSRLVWLLFPEMKSVGVCTLDEKGNLHMETVGIDGMLHGGDVLPGFRLAVRDVFDV